MRPIGMVAGILATVIAGTGTAAEMNISQFVFRDTNRNGIYEAGERPFPGVEVRLEQDAAAPLTRTSNLAGFANFAMSSDGDADIAAPGPVRFRVHVPDGFSLTTGSPSRQAVIRQVDGAPSGLAMTPALPFAGLAPELTIESGADGIASMTCDGGAGPVEARRAAGRLVCPVEPGTFSVTWRRFDGAAMSRTVEVGRWPVRVPAMSATPPGGTIRVESFDDVIAGMAIVEMPSSHGYRWHNMIAAHASFYGGWGYVNGTVSGAYSAYNSSGHPATLSSDRPFDFRGAFVSVAWPAAMDAPVRITAYRKGDVVAEDAFLASILRPVWFDANWRDIDRLVISHDRYWQVVVDDLTLSRR